MLDGKLLAEKITLSLKFENQPGLAVILVGDDPASELYTKKKVEACEKLGIYSERHELKSDIEEEELLALIDMLNKDEKIHGILVQLPLPKQIDTLKILRSVDPRKDVDGFHPLNLGRLMSGNPYLVACTPQAVMELIKSTGIEIKGKEAVVVSHSLIVGKPLSFLLLNEGATVTVCHEFTKDLKHYTKNADILVSATGIAGLIKKDMVKKDSIIIDVGISKVEGRIVGDVDPEVEKITENLTPVPGGVGPVTIACLLRNTIQASKL